MISIHCVKCCNYFVPRLHCRVVLSTCNTYQRHFSQLHHLPLLVLVGSVPHHPAASYHHLRWWLVPVLLGCMCGAVSQDLIHTLVAPQLQYCMVIEIKLKILKF